MPESGPIGTPSPEKPSQEAEIDPIGCLLTPLSLLFGGSTFFLLAIADPFRIAVITIPQGLDFADQMAAVEQWRSSPVVVLGQLATAWIPLAVSGLCGVFAHTSLPASISTSLVRTIGFATLLSVVLVFGEPIVERTFGQGGSSDIQAGVAGLAFTAFGLWLSARLSSAVTSRRPSCNKPRADHQGKNLD